MVNAQRRPPQRRAGHQRLAEPCGDLAAGRPRRCQNGDRLWSRGPKSKQFRQGGVGVTKHREPEFVISCLGGTPTLWQNSASARRVERLSRGRGPRCAAGRRCARRESGKEKVFIDRAPRPQRRQAMTVLDPRLGTQVLQVDPDPGPPFAASSPRGGYRASHSRTPR